MIRSPTNTYIKLKIWLKEFVQLCFFSEAYKLLFWVERALTLCKKNVLILTNTVNLAFTQCQTL